MKNDHHDFLTRYINLFLPLPILRLKKKPKSVDCMSFGLGTIMVVGFIYSHGHLYEQTIEP